MFEPIAQVDRALDCGSKGRRFESSWARLNAILIVIKKEDCVVLS